MFSRKQFSKDAICLDLQGATKSEVMEEMLDLLMATGRAPSRKEARRAIWDREENMSTGMPGGIAIPHGKCGAVDRLAVAIGLHRSGVDFEAMDGQPTHFVAMSLAPDNRSGPHIQFLADLSRKLSDPIIRRELAKATNAEQVIDLLTRPDPNP